jgi:NAD(P)-dependent dehydrogenase (short-subunit alcohol dehydrogenase family)
MAAQFEGKVALVTGAGSGIGRASARAFARAGAAVVVADIDAPGAAETVAMIEADGGRARAVETDVTKAADVEALVQRTMDAFGGLHYAHNNAGILGRATPTADCSEEEWDRIIAVNLKGVWLCMRAEVPRMLAQGGGAIVNTASTAGLVAMRGLPAYVASKHGVAGITKAAALDYAKTGIRINAVCPGFIDTPLVQRAGATQAGADRYVPVGRIGAPEEVAEAVVWLCSDAASYVTGHMLAVDGAMTAQ